MLGQLAGAGGGSSGSGLRQEGISEGWGEEDEVYEKPNPPPPLPSHFISLQRQPKGPFRNV